MSLLSVVDFLPLLQAGMLEGYDFKCINAASIDIRLGRYILAEDTDAELLSPRVSLTKREGMRHTVHDLRDGPFNILPGQFILAQSVEVFNLPNYIAAEYKLKSSMARIGLEHLNAGWCDPGWHGSVLTLELKNVTQDHTIIINEGDRIGQVIFRRCTEVPSDFSYATLGSYNNDKTVTGAKGGSE